MSTVEKFDDGAETDRAKPHSDTAKPLLIQLKWENILPDAGSAFVYVLPPYVPAGDTDATPMGSHAILFEEGVALGPAHVSHDEVRNEGNGRYSHWEGQLFFTASDNTSPKKNGKQYHLLIPPSLFVHTRLSTRTLIPLDRWRISAERGHAYAYDLTADIPPGDNDENPFSSRLLLFEDGIALGPAHSQHDSIRNQGLGRYSHWDSWLYFSASDNYSPLENGRQYHMLLSANLLTRTGELLAFSEGALGGMDPLERFHLARRFYRNIWKDTPLPDHGRQIDCDADFAREFTRLSPESDVTHERKYNLDQLFKLVHHIDGDVAECGVYKGSSAFFLARQIQQHGLDKRLCLFDSFEGLPMPGDLDGEYWASGNLTSRPDDIRKSLESLGPLPFVELYQGWIPERYPEVAARHFCFVHIDVDLHHPTLDSIAFFYPRMTGGGLILFDDYGFNSCPGVTQAIDRFMADKPEPIVNLASGGAFIMKRA